MKKKYFSYLLLISLVGTPVLELNAALEEIKVGIISQCFKLTKLLGTVGGAVYLFKVAKEKYDEKSNPKQTKDLAARVLKLEKGKYDKRIKELSTQLQNDKKEFKQLTENHASRIELLEHASK